MISANTPGWYVDTRPANSAQQISLDLTRHLPLRLAVGPAIIVTDRPTVLLPVIRRRWMRLMREVEKQRSSTMDHVRRLSLERELFRMNALHFTTKLDCADCADVLVITPAQTVCELPVHNTLYVAAPITPDQFAAATESATHGGVVVVYGDWRAYEKVLRERCAAYQYGEGTYPARSDDY